MAIRRIDIKDFADRVERMCEFILMQVDKDGSQDVTFVQQIKEDAADLQCIPNDMNNLSIDGIHDYMKGG